LGSAGVKVDRPAKPFWDVKHGVGDFVKGAKARQQPTKPLNSHVDERTSSEDKALTLTPSDCASAGCHCPAAVEVSTRVKFTQCT